MHMQVGQKRMSRAYVAQVVKLIMNDILLKLISWSSRIGHQELVNKTKNGWVKIEITLPA